MIVVALLAISIIIFGIISAVSEIINSQIMQDDFPDYWRGK